MSHNGDYTSDSLLVMLPTRGRKELLEKCVSSFCETTAEAKMLVITDDDDSSYDGVIFPANVAVCSIPRLRLTGKLNHAALENAGSYTALMFVGDDHVFSTPSWDTIMMKSLSSIGGTGFVYPDDKRRHDVPEIVLISSDIVKALGWFASPTQIHYYLDNIWADIGYAAGCLKFCPDAVVEHRHYSICADVPRDIVYQETESFGQQDAQAYQAWRHNQMDADVATVSSLLASQRVTSKGT